MRKRREKEKAARETAMSSLSNLRRDNAEMMAQLEQAGEQRKANLETITRLTTHINKNETRIKELETKLHDFEHGTFTLQRKDN